MRRGKRGGGNHNNYYEGNNKAQDQGVDDLFSQALSKGSEKSQGGNNYGKNNDKYYGETKEIL
jgi:membrane protein involved in colicin uptake